MFKRLFYIALCVMLRKYVDLRYTNTILTDRLKYGQNNQTKRADVQMEIFCIFSTF